MKINIKYRFGSKNNRISFNPESQVILDVDVNPIAAITMLPRWYRQLPQSVGDVRNPIKTHTIYDLKTCSPFRDALTAGYLVLLPIDIEITIDSNQLPQISWSPRANFTPTTHRGSVLHKENSGHGMPHPLGTAPMQFAWAPLWGFQTSQANSALVTHPLNRYDLPFITMSGIIDTGYMTTPGHVPFFIKEGFEGIIPRGTPILQVIPFKRQNWVSKVNEFNSKKLTAYATKRESIKHYYTSKLRQNKSYE